MVCVPCIVIPFLLWVFHKFVQPWLSKIWSKPEAMVKNVEDNLVCPMPKRKKVDKKDAVDVKKQDDSISSESSATMTNGHANSAVNGDTNLGERLKAE